MHPVSNHNFGVGKVKAFYFDGTALATGYIVKQVGTTRYVVTSNGTTTFTVTLAPTAALATRLDGTSSLGTTTDLVGLATFTLTVGGVVKYVTKLNSFTAVTSDGSTYSWTLGAASGSVYAITPHVVVVTPLNTVLPTISGTAQVGQVLTATTGTWTGTAPTSYTYVWTVGGTVASGATTSTYTPVTGDIGKTVTVTVNAVLAGTSPVAVTSTATAAVIAA